MCWYLSPRAPGFVRLRRRPLPAPAQGELRLAAVRALATAEAAIDRLLVGGSDDAPTFFSRDDVELSAQMVAGRNLLRSLYSAICGFRAGVGPLWPKRAVRAL